MLINAFTTGNPCLAKKMFGICILIGGISGALKGLRTRGDHEPQRLKGCKKVMNSVASVCTEVSSVECTLPARSRNPPRVGLLYCWLPP